ncbi:MAG: organic solvent tolerance protein OstA [Hyphomicrobiales bacterium]|nr:organic solvent tolerance protein OstA [Hyphomicrobiales bacterium]
MKIVAALALLFALGAAGARAATPTPVLPGGAGGQPVSISADRLDYSAKDHQAIYAGSVVAKQGDATLDCSRLVVTFAAQAGADPGAPPTSGALVSIEATGPVTLTQKDERATGDHGVYDRAAGTVTLSGHVRLSQGGNVTTGDTLVYALASGRATLTAARGGPRVGAVFLPGSTPPKR